MTQAAHAMDVADIDCSRSKTRSFLVNIFWILMISSKLEHVLVCPADVATN